MALMVYQILLESMREKIVFYAQVHFVQRRKRRGKIRIKSGMCI